MTPEKDVDSKSAEGQNKASNDADIQPDPSSEAADAKQEAADVAAESIEGLDPSDPLAFMNGVMAGDDKVEDPDLSEVSVEVLREKLTQAEELAKEHWDRLLRMQAEHENQTKRAEKKIADARKYALESMVNDLLPIKDSLEMGISAAQEEDTDLAKIVEGSELTLKMLAQTFEKYHITEINPINEKFDPEFHQAMSMQELEGKEPNTVASVFQKGYTLNERLIRPALVMVAK